MQAEGRTFAAKKKSKQVNLVSNLLISSCNKSVFWNIGGQTRTGWRFLDEFRNILCSKSSHTAQC